MVQHRGRIVTLLLLCICIMVLVFALVYMITHPFHAAALNPYLA